MEIILAVGFSLLAALGYLFLDRRSPGDAGLVLLELDAGAVEIHRHDRVLPDREDDVHHLAVVEALPQTRPGGVADVLVAMEFVGGTEERGVGRCPAVGIRPARDARELR